MGKIQILPEELSNRIAAGEVVERPASVVKELFENAVDAGATKITIEIERAGSRLIRISDNGCGMDENDALLAFSPHATSKIHSAEDIEAIHTLGFRGEALPSIASVSRLSLKTRTANNPAGVEIDLEGGKLIGEAPAGLPVGTILSVRDLFFNVPARKKFLRTAATEEAHIQEIVTALALGFPQVAVTLKLDGRIAMQIPSSGELLERIAGIFGKVFSTRMRPLLLVKEGVKITGFIAQPGFTRPSRREQRLFVNGRAVESQCLFRGIRDGYGTLADFGRFPPVILNFELDPAEYDINVHPTKREIRFKREGFLSGSLTGAIRQALQEVAAPEMVLPEMESAASPETWLKMAEISSELPPEELEIPGLASEKMPESVMYAEKEETLESAEIPEKTGSAAPVPVAETNLKTAQTAREDEPKFTDWEAKNALPETPPKTPLALELSQSENLRFLGILLETYLVIESVQAEALLLIDFHAAHERVLYEQLLKKAESEDSLPSQALLLPFTVELGRTATAFLSKNEEIFGKLGFDLALLSSNTLLVNAIPANLPSDADWEKILSDVVAQALDEEKTTRDRLESIARAACHAAVKAHDPLTETGARALLKDLAKCDRPDVCPHGRPTVLRISKNELGHRFGRV